jgi:transcriptional regulator with XRE-family HTH domain
MARRPFRCRPPLVDPVSAGPGRDEPIDPAIWQRDDMREAMSHHDIGAMFKILGRHGISQRRMAAQTGQSQSEISEILSGRKVVAYDVLARIADGFGVPRAWLGLHLDPHAPPLAGATRIHLHLIFRVESRQAATVLASRILTEYASDDVTVRVEQDPSDRGT